VRRLDKETKKLRRENISIRYEINRIHNYLNEQSHINQK